MEENPEYFYDILPYTYVLDVSSKWTKKFESLTMSAPNWYSSEDDRAFDIILSSFYVFDRVYGDDKYDFDTKFQQWRRISRWWFRRRWRRKLVKNKKMLRFSYNYAIV